MSRAMRWVAAVVVSTTPPLAMSAHAAGQSPIEVLSITPSPGSFQAGSSVTFSVQIRNTATYRTKAATAYIDVFKGERLVATDHLWGATTDVLRLDPGTTTVVDFIWRNEMRGSARAREWTVPGGDVNVFSVRAGVLDLPSDRANMKVARFERKCSYSRLKPLVATPQITLAELRRLDRPTPK